MIKFLLDSLSIIKETNLEFIEKHQEAHGIFSFVFKSPHPVDWIPGQHGMFILKKRGIKKPLRFFSLTSTPEEGKISICTKISDHPSEFKKALLGLNPGDAISMRGPVGILKSEIDTPQIFIAAGIGITPYRSILKDLVGKSGKSLQDTALIYLDRENSHLFTPDWASLEKHPKFNVHYTNDREALTATIQNSVEKYHNTALYYMVGPKAMVKSTRALLLDLGIQRKQIRRESFLGY